MTPYRSARRRRRSRWSTLAQRWLPRQFGATEAALAALAVAVVVWLAWPAHQAADDHRRVWLASLRQANVDSRDPADQLIAALPWRSPAITALTRAGQRGSPTAETRSMAALATRAAPPLDLRPGTPAAPMPSPQHFVERPTEADDYAEALRAARSRPPAPDADLAALSPPSEPRLARPRQELAVLPTWLRNAVSQVALDDRPAIALVLDDLGMNRGNTAALNRLPGPLTLAFLPYAEDLARQTAAAHQAGHELLVHMPMEPIGAEWPGPQALLTSLDDQEFTSRLETSLDRFGGYVGINNHMGSKLTTDAHRMALVMAVLQRRGLMFLDSRTSPNSVGVAEARRQHVAYAGRDVFLDNRVDLGAIQAQLAQVERVARQRGSAVAIGHPHDATIEALRGWLGGLSAKGFQLVPISAIAARQACEDGLVANVCGRYLQAQRSTQTARVN